MVGKAKIPGGDRVGFWKCRESCLEQCRSPEPPCPDKPSTEKYFFCQNNWEPHYHGNKDFNSPRSRKRGQLQSWPLIWRFLAQRKIPLLRSPPYGTCPPWGQSPQTLPMSPSEGYKPEKCINSKINFIFCDHFLKFFFHLSFWDNFLKLTWLALSALAVGRTISKIVGYYLHLNLHIQ